MASPGVVGRRPGQRAGRTATVSVHVRDLDRTAAEFIEDEFRDKPSADVWHLQVHVLEGDTSATDLQQAVESYYARMAHSARLAMREHLRLGQVALVGGLSIFLLSMGAREILGRALGHLPVLLDEGLIILAWLALWRPAEALIYGWVPFYRNRRRFERLAAIRVFVRASPSPGVHPHPVRIA